MNFVEWNDRLVKIIDLTSNARAKDPIADESAMTLYSENSLPSVQ